MVGPRAEAMICKALSVDELWRQGRERGAASINTPLSSLCTHHFLQDSLPSGLFHSLASQFLKISLFSIYSCISFTGTVHNQPWVGLWYLSWGDFGDNLFYDWHPEGLRGLPRSTAASGWGVPYNKTESLVTWFYCSDIATAFCCCPFRLRPNIGPIFCPGVIFCAIMKLNSLLWLWVLTVSQVAFITNW